MKNSNNQITDEEFLSELTHYDKDSKCGNCEYYDEESGVCKYWEGDVHTDDFCENWR